MATQSLLLPSLSLQLPIASAKPKTLALAFPLSSSNNSSVAIKHLYLSHSIPHSRKFHNLDSGVVRRVAVSSEFEQEEEEVLSGEGPDLKLFVGNLPFSVNSNELTDLFDRAGTVETAEVIYDKTGRSRGFAFVTMATVEEVEAAIQQFNGYELSGRALRVNSGPPPPKDELPSRGFRSGGSTVAGNRVYIGNLSWDVQDSDLETLFSEQGRVVEAKVVYDRESGRSRGFGFVTYSSSMEVNNAVSSLDGVDLDGRRIRVSVAEERPRRQF